MLAVDDKFAVRDGVSERHSPGEHFVCTTDFARNEERVAQRSVSHGKLRRILILISQTREVPRKCDRPRDRLTHQARIPGETSGCEPARRCLTAIRELHRAERTLFYTQRTKAMNSNQRYGEVEHELKLLSVALFARRQLFQEVEGAPEMRTCLGMSR